jgi:hypothetical protein
MSSASDISNLFQMLGVSPSHYQEVEKTEQVQGSRGRWSAPATSPEHIAPSDAAREAETVLPADAADATEAPPTAQPQPIASAVPAAASASLPALQAEPEQPVLQSDPEPVIAAQRPDALSAVFARLREQSEPQADVARRLT